MAGIDMQYAGFKPLQAGWSVERVSAVISADDFFSRFVFTRTPVILEGGLAGAAPVVDPAKWTPSALDAAAGGAMVCIEQRDSSTGTFGTGKKIPQPLSTFLRAAGQSNLYLTTQPLAEDEQGVPTELYAEPLKHMQGAFPLSPAITGNLVTSSINIWMGRSKPTSEVGASKAGVGVGSKRSAGAGAGAGAVLGSGALIQGQSSNLHHDFHDNVYVLLRGRKHFTIAPPSDAPRMYTHGAVTKVHANGLINYGGVSTRGDGLLEDAEEDEEDEEEEPTVGVKKAGKRARALMDLLAAEEEDEEEREDSGAGASKGKSKGSGNKKRKVESAAGSQKDADDADAMWAFLLGGAAAGPARTAVAGSKGQAAPKVAGRKAKGGAEAGAGAAAPADTVPDHFSRVPLPRLRHAVLSPSSSSSRSEPSSAWASICAHPEVRKSFPALAGAAVTSFELGPGDMLYLPAGWFHEVVSMGSPEGVGAGAGAGAGVGGLDTDPDLHMALNYWFYPPTQVVGAVKGAKAMKAAFTNPYADGAPARLFHRALATHQAAVPPVAVQPQAGAREGKGKGSKRR